MAPQPSFDDAGKLGKEYFDNGLKGFAAFSKGFQAIAVEAGEYAKKSFEAGAAAFEKVLAAKSIDGALEIQAEYAKSAYEGFVAQATRMSEMYADLAKEVYRPYETLVSKSK